MTQFTWILIADIIVISLDQLVFKRITGAALELPYYIFIGIITCISYLLFI